MRKYHQKMILELLKSLEEATDNLKKLLSKKDLQSLTNLLADCQETAIQIGQFIEQMTEDKSQKSKVESQKVEDLGLRTITLLEEYCDLLYHANVELNKPESGAGPIKKLQKQIVKIEESVKSDLRPDKIEVVFFPYKASMWDSLESIWLAAKDDPACDAYVVPIPYYDKKPDGSFGQMHYEGDKYPDYVPVVDWKNYNVEEHHPDAVFIHNPYDGNNLVTGIHPDYYAEKLKDLTDSLVYVPYFVTGDAIEEHFCVQAASIYAGKVIVESEKIRQSYIRYFKEFGLKTKSSGRFGKPEDKFFALGSPKYDKVINTKREDNSLPGEWAKLIAGKKVVLYNTSVGSILRGNNWYLEKLRFVMELFRKRSDVVLWWRPHPLSKSVYSSMRSYLLGEYLSFVEEYRMQGWGIYDDSADLHRAIASSDAYYGDGSSLVWLYQCTGNPIMYQDEKIRPKNRNLNNLAFNNLYDDGENFWFTSNCFNALFKMDRQTWKSEYMGRFPNENDNWGLYGQIIKYGRKLYFAPRSANEIAVYDIITKSFDKISFAEPKHENKNGYNDKAKFGFPVLYEKYLFFTPGTYPAIMRYDTENDSLDYFSDWVKPLEKISDGDEYYFGEGIVSEKKIILPAVNANAIVIFDMETCTSSITEIGYKKYRHGNFCFDGKNYWFAPRFDGPVVRWNPVTKEYKEFSNYPAGFESGKICFFKINYSNGYVWLLPYNANMALKINITEETIAIADEFQSECKYNGEAAFECNYYMSKVTGDKLYAHTGKSNRLIEYDFNTKQRREEAIAFSEETVERLTENHSKLIDKIVPLCSLPNDCCYSENVLNRLQGFLNYVTHDSEDKTALSSKQVELRKNIIANSNGRAGQAIYDYCKKAAINP